MERRTRTAAGRDLWTESPYRAGCGTCMIGRLSFSKILARLRETYPVCLLVDAPNEIGFG